jgi:hypothetical protein
MGARTSRLEGNLPQGEKVIYSVNTHWWIYSFPLKLILANIFFWVAVVLASFNIEWVVNITISDVTGWFWYSFLAAIFAAVLFFEFSQRVLVAVIPIYFLNYLFSTSKAAELHENIYAYWWVLLGGYIVYTFYLPGRALLSQYIHDRHSEMVLTPNYIVNRAGYLQESIDMLDIRKIEYVSVQQTFLGRLLGFGDVRVSTFGDAGATYCNTTEPHEFKKQILDQVNYVN